MEKELNGGNDLSTNELEDDEVRNRIKYLLKLKGTNYTALAGNGTAMQSKFQRQLSKSAVTYCVLVFILKKFPDVSAEWLMLGEGSVTKQKSDAGIIVNAPKNSGNQVIGDGTIESKGDEINLLKDMFEQNKKLQDILIELSKK